MATNLPLELYPAGSMAHVGECSDAIARQLARLRGIPETFIDDALTSDRAIQQRRGVPRRG
jgi:hypothetical protein